MTDRPVYNHENPENASFTPPTFLKEWEVKKIDDFIEKNIGTCGMVFHELVSDTIHVDVYRIDPREQYDFYTLVTVGMSALPMHTPPSVKSRFMELMISLPKTWKLDQKDFNDETNYWPVRILKELARFPFMYKTWLGFGHTIPNGNPPEPVSENSNFRGLLLLPSLMFKKSWKCKVGLFKEVNFLAVHPLYENEMNHKVEYGVDSLLDKFDEYKVTEVTDINRPEIVFEQE
jgi:hypothetical protein